MKASTLFQKLWNYFIRQLNTEARAHVAGAANATLTLLHWRIGQRICVEVLGARRGAYGAETAVTLSRAACRSRCISILATVSQQFARQP